jgi:serine/threonine protein kinase
MNSSVEPAPVSDQFEPVAELVVVNGWSDRPRLEALRNELMQNGRQAVLTDQRAVTRLLVERRLISTAQLADLDSILQQQVHFPTYHLMKRLGAGGMGTVFLARQAGTGRILAIKTIIARLREDPDFVGRFHRESKVLSGLRHPYIAEIIESGESDSTCYMSMEYVDGPSLASLLKDHKVLPEAYVLRVAKQLAEGLAYVYREAELVHRDIKPENILIARQPSVTEPFPADDVAKLIDFGLVKPVTDDEHLTQTGMTIGTPLYMSPEQIRGERIDCRSDIYGLGATMYHLLTGVTPFSGTSPGAIMSAHLTQVVPDPCQRVPGLHAKTRDLVMTAMAKKRDDRFLTFEAFIKALDAALDELGERSGTVPRLLRKPLVLKGPVRKPATLPNSEPTVDGTVPMADQTLAGTTDRILNKFKQKQDQEAPRDGAKAGINPVVTLQAAPRPVSQRIELPPDPGKPRTAVTSKVFDEDPAEAVGTGIIPWLVLGAAIAAVIIWYFI